MAGIDDQYYITRVIEGDTQAFAVLVNQYKDMVFSLALKMIRQREEAEELAQDAFVKAYRSLAGFKNDSRFSTWLYTITYNTCLDRLRKNKRQQQVISTDEYYGHLLMSISDTLEIMEKQERELLIKESLNQLPEEDSFLLTLFYFEEQSVKEIGQIMAINANHVKIKLFRSRKKLATVLQKQLSTEIIEQYENE